MPKVAQNFVPTKPRRCHGKCVWHEESPPTLWKFLGFTRLLLTTARNEFPISFTRRNGQVPVDLVRPLQFVRVLSLQVVAHLSPPPTQPPQPSHYHHHQPPGKKDAQPPSVKTVQFAHQLPSLEVAAVSQAKSPDSSPHAISQLIMSHHEHNLKRKRIAAWCACSVVCVVCDVVCVCLPPVVCVRCLSR